MSVGHEADNVIHSWGIPFSSVQMIFSYSQIEIAEGI